MKYLALLLALTSLASAQTGTVNPTGGGIVNPAFRNAVLPAQSTHSGKFLTTDGTNASWSATA
jgi:hypothetical protein